MRDRFSQSPSGRSSPPCRDACPTLSGRMRDGCGTGLPGALPNRLHQRIRYCAVTRRVRGAGARRQIAGQADARLLHHSGLAGDGDHRRIQRRVGLQESLLDNPGRQSDGFRKVFENIRYFNGMIRPARCGEIGSGRHSRVAAMLFPLIPGQSARPHDICHRRRFGARRIALGGPAIAGPALFILWPKPVQDETMPMARIALIITPRVTFQPAICRGPAKRKHKIIEITRRLTLGKGGRCP